jgi:hypothetical protein
MAPFPCSARKGDIQNGYAGWSRLLLLSVFNAFNYFSVCSTPPAARLFPAAARKIRRGAGTSGPATGQQAGPGSPLPVCRARPVRASYLL